MLDLVYRPATPADIPGMAEVRAGDWGSDAYWRERIAGYLSGESNPRDALRMIPDCNTDGVPHPGRESDSVGPTPSFQHRHTQLQPGTPTRVAFVCVDQERITIPTRATEALVEDGATPTPSHATDACVGNDRIVGLIAGHLTRRFGCDGELEWISVRPEFRELGIASQLLRRLAEWFLAQDVGSMLGTALPERGLGARRICVDVEPTNRIARRFYARHGAIDLKPHWMVWEDIGKLCE